jgi:hypothetical protein
MSAIGTEEMIDLTGRWSAFWGEADAFAEAHDLGMPAPGSKIRATFIKIGELPSTATHQACCDGTL